MDAAAMARLVCTFVAGRDWLEEDLVCMLLAGNGRTQKRCGGSSLR